MRSSQLAEFFLCFAISTIFFACSLSKDKTTEDEYGYVTISVLRSAGIKTIAPGVDLTAATYDVVYSRTGYTSVTQTKQTAAYLAVSPTTLQTGTWNISITAYNAGNTAIGAGDVAVTIEAGKTANASVTIAILPGTGAINLGIDWSSLTAISNPSITGTLTPTSGSVISLVSAISGQKATLSSTAIASGSYMLTVILNDGTSEVARAVDAVLIIQSTTASGAINFTKSSSSTGAVSITITLALPSNITYSFSPASGKISAGATITATPSSAVNSYSWYLDGVVDSTQTTAIYTTPSALPQGEYCLTVVGKSGSYLSSGSMNFTI